MKNKKVLVVAAHPDDEVLGCGGTIARLVREGNTVYSLILGEGITSRDVKRDRGKRAQEIKELKKQIEQAGRILSIKNSFVYDFPDNRFDTVALLDIIKKIEKVKKIVNPHVVFTHHHGDLNIDHQITFKAVMTAFRPVKGERAREILCFETPSSTEWNASSPLNYFMPDYFVDISRTLKAKIKALKVYKSEMRTFPHPRSSEAVEIAARNRGVQAGTAAAEAFKVVRIIY
jgi:LmbE family N-acetylglucosaminyl deacetylase